MYLTPRRVLSPAAGIIWAIATLDLVARPMMRRGIFGAVGTDGMWKATLVAALACAVWIWAARRRGVRTFAAFAMAFSVGVTAQSNLGARLQSDGFYYFAYLRSMAFDRDVNFQNDYKALGLNDKPYLFEPTKTGYAQSAWTIGPAIVWSPFFAAGHVVSTQLAKTNPNVIADGTAFPYRQAVCLAGLFYGLLGVYFTMRFAEIFAGRRLAAAAAALSVGGSFLLWYIVREPSMTHAPTLASVAAFAWVWAATLGRRRLWQWAALGALGGLMALIRWQSAIFGLMPLVEIVAAVIAASRKKDRQALIQLATGAAVGGVAFVFAFLPQMIAWKSIYGSFVAVSPLGPEIRWRHPHVVDILWSSRNGLFALSPILYVAAFGLPVLVKRHLIAGIAIVASILAMVYFNSAIQDWWGSASFGGRRFDGTVPLFAVALALALDVGRRWIARWPFVPVAAVLLAAAAWNTTFAATIRRNVFDGARANDFGAIGADQARATHARVGHPFSYPVNLGFAVENRISPAAYDLIAPNLLLADGLDLGRIDIGSVRDVMVVGDGFFVPESDGRIGYRWVTKQAEILLPIAHIDRTKFQIRLHAYTFDGAPKQRVTIRINDTAFGPFDVLDDWHVIEFTVERSALRRTINRVRLEFDRADAPTSHGGTDTRLLAAVVDFIRIDAMPEVK